MDPAEFQAALLDYLEVCAGHEDVVAKMLGEVGPDLKAYVQSWQPDQVELALFLFKKWSLPK